MRIIKIFQILVLTLVLVLTTCDINNNNNNINFYSSTESKYNSINNKGDKKMIVGLYSICNGTNHTSQHAFHMELYSRIWHRHNNKTIFVSYDVCGSIMRLSVIIENLLLDDRYFNYQTSRYVVRAFVVALDNDLLKHLYQSVWHTRIPIFPLSNETDFIEKGQNPVGSPYVFWYPGFNLEAMKILARWSTGRVLVVKDDDEPAYTEIIDSFFQYLRDEKICYKSFKYDGFSEWIADYSKDTFIYDNGLLLVIDTNEPNNYEELTSSTLYQQFSKEIQSKIASIKFEVQSKDQCRHMIESYQSETGHIINETAIHDFINSSIYRADAFSTFRLLDENFHKKDDKLNQNLRNYNPNTRNERSENQTVDWTIKCRKRCPAGQQNQYKVNGDEGNFECVPCPSQKYKLYSGIGQCEECPKNQFADVTQTSCHPNLRYVETGSASAILCIFLSTILIIVCLLICFIFYKYKDTPIVTTSRLRTSIVHLIVIMSIFITVPIAYIGYPNEPKCFLQPLIIAVLYNCNISLLLTKSNKILSAYNSKQVSSVFTVRREKAAEIFVVLLNQAIVLCIVITAFYSDPVKVFEMDAIYDGKATTVVYCNTMDEHNIAVGYTMFLKVLCLVQAFRCRRLPSVLNEAMEIVYSCIIAIFFCTIKLIIHFSTRQDQVIKQKVIMAGFIILDAVILFIMYGRKAFLILYRPHLNTKKYFQQEFLRQMQKKAKKVVGKKKIEKHLTSSLTN